MGDPLQPNEKRVGKSENTITKLDPRMHRNAIYGDVDNFGTQIVGFRSNQFEINFSEGNPEDLMDVVTSTGSGSSAQVAGNGEFYSGTDTDMEYRLQSFAKISYSSAHSLYLYFTSGWATPPTGANDRAQVIFGDTTDGYAVGYKGTEWGIQHFKGGVEEDFIVPADFLFGDITAGENTAFVRATKDPNNKGEIVLTPESVDFAKMQLLDILFGWLSIAPTHFRMESPFGSRCPVHTIQHINLRVDGQTETASLPVQILIKKVASDATNITMRLGCIGAGIVANVNVAQQPDGDFVIEKADGTAFETRATLGAGATFDSRTANGVIDIDGWGSYDLTIKTDQISAGDGIVVNHVRDAQEDTPVVIFQETFEVTASDLTQGFSVDRNTRGDGLYVTYTNGGTPQGAFTLQLNLRREPIVPQSGLETAINDTLSVIDTRTAHFAKSGTTGEYGLLGRGGLDEGLDSHITDSEPRALRKTMERQLVSTHDLTATSTQLDATQLPNRSAILLTVDPDNNQAVHINLGASATTTSMKLDAGYGIPAVIGNNITIHGRSVSGTQRVYLWQLGEPL